MCKCDRPPQACRWTFANIIENTIADASTVSQVRITYCTSLVTHAIAVGPLLVVTSDSSLRGNSSCAYLQVLQVYTPIPEFSNAQDPS
jgi:hypothetical protein